MGAGAALLPLPYQPAASSRAPLSACSPPAPPQNRPESPQRITQHARHSRGQPAGPAPQASQQLQVRVAALLVDVVAGKKLVTMVMCVCSQGSKSNSSSSVESRGERLTAFTGSPWLRPVTCSQRHLFSFSGMGGAILIPPSSSLAEQQHVGRRRV